MSNARIIEVDGEAAGIVVADARGFQFYAAAQPFYALEGIRFRTSRDAERAAAAMLSGRHDRRGERASRGGPPLRR